MDTTFETRGLTKRFGAVTALDGVDLTVRRPSIVGLLGRNGSGKTTLIRHLTGLVLPDAGSVTVLGQSSDLLGHDELGRIGHVPQEIRLLDWMTVEQHLDYVACFYPAWDRERQARLLRDLELEPGKLVGALSAGNLQKLAILLAVGHHPKLLLLDEPVSDLDPIARSAFLELLLQLLAEDEATIVVSSHVLRDVEKVVDHVVCLERGRVVTDEPLDDLKERFAEWRVTAANGAPLPVRFEERYVVAQEVEGRQARLVVRDAGAEIERFRAVHGAEVTARPLNLEELFPLMIEERTR